MTATIIYQGDLRCECLHVQSGTIIETDAPTDNRGKGERFSPTDLLCVSLATCIITTMGIKAADKNIDLSNTKLQVQKHMIPEPRRIGKIDIKIDVPATNMSAEEKRLLEKIAHSCPVARSLHPDIELNVEFTWA